MMAYHIINIFDLIRTGGKELPNELISPFSCPLNPEVERFALTRAVDFADRSIAATYLVFENDVLTGFFTLVNKVLRIPRHSVSRSTGKRLDRFSESEATSSTFVLAAPLIAQISKNYSVDNTMSGHVLLELAMGEIALALHQVGGQIAYLECEDIPALTAFYAREGFRCVAQRVSQSGTKYHVYIKFLKSLQVA